MAETKIPVLTEVYQPKPESKLARQADPTLGVTPELIARVAAHVRPRLEAEITQSVLDSIGEIVKKDLIQAFQPEIKNTHDEIVTSTKDFVDKTKADLKTELPRMYQASADLVHESLLDKFSSLQNEISSKLDTMLADKVQAALQEATAQIDSHVQTLQVDASGHIMQQLNNEMESFKEKALVDHQAQLSKTLNSLLQAISEHGEQDLQQKMQAIQAQSLADHQTQLSESLENLQQTIAQNAEQSLQGELAALQQKAISDHQVQLTESLNSLLQTKGEGAEQEIMQKMQAFQEKLQVNHQEQLAQALDAAMESISQRIEESTHEQVGLMHSQVGSIQQETLAQLRATFIAEKTEIYNAAVAEVKTVFTEQMIAQSMEVRDSFLSKVNGDLPAVQEVLREHVEQMIATAMPTLENDLRKQLTTELHALLLKVKFVLPS